MKLSVILLFLSFSTAFAQKMEGEIIYEKVTSWPKLYGTLTYMSNEERDRIKQTWGTDESKQEMRLLFNGQKSFYTNSKHLDNDAGWSWNDKEYKIYRDMETEKRTDIIEMLGKIYIVEDSVRSPKWKIMNKIKEIGGYMCMMAVTEDTVKNQKITAWFADNIPLGVGPELYGGLPGMILELDINDGIVVTTAKKIDLKPITEDVEVPKKVKGRKINEQQYNTMVANHVKDSFKARRAFFWSMPY